MQSLRQIGAGFLLGGISIALLIGTFALAMAEGNLIPSANPTSTSANITPTLQPIFTLQIATSTAVISPTPTETFTPPPPPTNCPPPAGWIAVPVGPLDTLDNLAIIYQTTKEQLKAGNCLVSDNLVPGTMLYAPSNPTATSVPCGAPAGWIDYRVQPGDTLFQLSLRYRVGIAQLQQANCLGYSNVIYVGQILKVPNVPTSTPGISPTVPVTPVETVTTGVTVTAITPTVEASSTSTPETPTEIPPSVVPSDTTVSPSATSEPPISPTP